MLRQPRLAFKVGRRAAGLRFIVTTDAVPDKSYRPDTSASSKVMPIDEASQPGSDRTWNAFHGITFASNHGTTLSQSAFRPIHGRTSQEIGSQEDTWSWTESQTRKYTESRDENRGGFENVVSSNRPMHLVETQHGNMTVNPSANNGGHSPDTGHPEGCPASDTKTFRAPLGFHIPESKLREAMLAEPTSIASYWHFSLYQGPGGDKVKVHYCKSKETTEKIAQLFLDKEELGFDIEWQPNASAADGITKNVSLIQLASEERVLLAHIARYPNAAISEKEQRVEDFVAPSLKTIMESRSISKVGVGIKADCTRLRKSLSIDSHGLFELSHLYKLVKFSTGDVKKINKALVSLAQQVQEHLQLPLAKGDVRMSDWSNSQDLTYEQTRYAASDSYAALQLYHIMEAKRSAMEPTPPRPAHAERNIPILLANGQTVESFDIPSESVEEASTDALSSTCISLEDGFQKMAVEDPASFYPHLPASPAASSSSSSSSAPFIASNTPASSNPPSTTPTNNDLPPEIVEANASVTEYIQTRPPGIKPKPNKAHLRAHHLWEHHSMEPNAMATLLHVDLSTVAVYILQAIRIEHFPFEEKRTRALVPLAPRLLRDDFENMIRQRVRKRSEPAGEEKGQ